MSGLRRLFTRLKYVGAVPPASTLVALALGFVSTPALAESVVCHVSYGGETKQILASPAVDPHTVKPLKFGSYFLFRLVVQTPPSPLPSTRIFVYSDSDEGPVPIHIAEHPFPQSRTQKKPGFTGWQSVYEPMRDGELQYWCARQP
jgi:hypothetical protein